LKDKDIAALLESLCERPLADNQTAPSAELLALCRDAATVLLQDSDAEPGGEAVDIADTGRITAALAELLSRDNAEAARQMIETAAARSAAIRLDVQSARTFVDAVEQSPQSAPAHLVDALLAADRARLTHSTAPAARAKTKTIWSRIVGRSSSARRWRIVTACTVLLAAGAASWSVYWQQTGPVADNSVALPAAKATSEASAIAARPAPLTPVLTTAQPCEPRIAKSEASKAARSRPAEAAKMEPSAETDCATPAGHQFADRPAEELEAIAARARREAARQAAAERAAAEAAGKIGAAQAGRPQGPVAAEHFGPLNGMPGDNFPAAASTLPAAPSPYGLAPPAAAPATRPYPVGR
jgi:hypothetical protein